MNLWFLFLTISLSVSLIQCISNCGQICQATYTKEAQCLRKVKDDLKLECESNNEVVSFYRKNDDRYISGYNIQFYSDDKNYSVAYDKFNLLNINKLRRIDSGEGSFQAFNIFNKTNTCNFSIYLFDQDYENGLLKYGAKSWKIDQPVYIQINPKLNLTYRYEALPLDDLVINQISSIKTSKCKSSSYDWLECLETSIPVEIEQCQNNLNFTFSYKVSNTQPYSCETGNMIQPKIYEKIINIHYPPVVVDKTQIKTYTKLKEEIELECKVKCSNPKSLIFTWTSNDIFLESSATNENSHKFKYKINANSDIDEFEVTCTVSNGFYYENVDISNSKTIYKIIHKNKKWRV